MAVNERWMLESPGRLDEDTNTYYANVIIDEGAPDGDADPQASALMGSVYIRVNYGTDDVSHWYMKVDTDSADDDWAKFMIDASDDAYTRNGTITMNTSNAIYLRDTGQIIYSPAANVGALALASSSDYWRFGDMGSSNYWQLDYYGELKAVGVARINGRARFDFFDDFIYQTINETDFGWVLNSGSDDLAVDPAISTQECGVLVLTTGDGDGTFAVDGSQLVCAIPVQADRGGFVFETRLHINTAVTNISVFAGVTDTTDLEEPFSNAADVITSNCADGAGFLYDTSATTDTWWGVAVDGNSDDAGNATTTKAPVADTYQTLRMDVSSDGATVAFRVDGVLYLTLSGSFGVSPDVNLYATICACGDSTASKSVDVDYVYFGVTR